MSRRPLHVVGAGIIAFSLSTALAQSRVEQAVINLADERLRRDACAVLIADGPAACDALKPRLALLESTDPGETCAALYVLGRLGREAVVLLPEVLRAFELGRHAIVRRQALWAIGQIAPLSPEAGTCALCLAAIERYAAADIDQFLADTVIRRLRLGGSPSVGSMRACLDSGAAGAIAVSEALCADSALDREERDGLIEQVETLMAAAQGPYEWPWDNGSRYIAAIGSMAMVLWNAGDHSPSVANGLLRHWDPAIRQVALLALADAVLLSVEGRLEVSWLLGDEDSQVRDLALGTVGGWGAKAVVALPHLAARSRGGSSVAFSAGCQKAMRQIVTAAESDQVLEAARVALAERRVKLLDPKSSHVPSELTDIIAGCRGLGDGTISVLAEFVAENELANAAVADAFIRCLGTETPAAWNEAIRALMRLGPVVCASRPDFSVIVLRATSISGVPLRTAALAEAWVSAGPSANADQLCDAIDSEKWYVALRGLAEVVRRGSPTSAAIRATVRSRDRVWSDVEIRQGAEWTARKGYGGAYVTMEANAPAIVAAATIVLMCADDERWKQPVALRDTAKALGISEDRIVAELRAARLDNRLVDLCNRLEATLRCEPFVQ